MLDNFTPCSSENPSSSFSSRPLYSYWLLRGIRFSPREWIRFATTTVCAIRESVLRMLTLPTAFGFFSRLVRPTNSVGLSPVRTSIVELSTTFGFTTRLTHIEQVLMKYSSKKSNPSVQRTGASRWDHYVSVACWTLLGPAR